MAVDIHVIPFPGHLSQWNGGLLATPVPATLLPMVDQDVLISDANGNGVQAQATASLVTPSTLGLVQLQRCKRHLIAPLTFSLTYYRIARKTVANEILGSGDATITTGQEFTLQKSPLTYLQSAASTSGDDYSSTLSIWVNGVRWKKCPAFTDRLRTPPSL